MKNKIIVYKSSKKSPFSFSPMGLNIKDDAFHDSEAPRFTEWWYFDAVFENGYSAQMSVRLLSIIKNRLVLIYQRLDIYKEGKLLKHNKKRFSLKKFDASKNKPIVKLDGKKVVTGKINNKTKDFIYNLSFEIENCSANLKFTGTTKGWKGKNPGGDWWGVILPRAKVEGEIKINNEKIPVKGSGYHDHNWDVRASAATNNHGWFWGKINTENYSITWATIFKNRKLGQPLIVVNKKNGGYYNFKPEDIEFLGTDLRKNNGKYIPYKFILKADNKDINIDFKMNVLDTHHVKMMLRMHYWRFHVQCNGAINFKSKEEKIKETHIAEFLRFK